MLEGMVHPICAPGAEIGGSLRLSLTSTVVVGPTTIRMEWIKVFDAVHGPAAATRNVL